MTANRGATDAAGGDFVDTPGGDSGGGSDADVTADPDGFVDRLHHRVIRPLSAASFELSSLAAALDDSHRARELLDCVDQLDAAISRIRTSTFDEGENRAR